MVQLRSISYQPDPYSPRCVSPKLKREQRRSPGSRPRTLLSPSARLRRYRRLLAAGLLGVFLLGTAWCFLPRQENKSPEPETPYKRDLRTLQSPLWWSDPWALPASQFPRLSLYPDPDWNPHPLWHNTSIPSLQDPQRHAPPSSFACNEESHPFYGGSIAPGLAGGTRSSPLLFMGVFSSLQPGKEYMRDIIRRRQLPHFHHSERYQLQQGGAEGRNFSHPSHEWGDMDIPAGVLEWKFVLGYPRGWRRTVKMIRDGTLSWRVARDPWMRRWNLGTPKEGSFVSWDGVKRREQEGVLGGWRTTGIAQWVGWAKMMGFWRRNVPVRLGGWKEEEIALAREQVKTMHLLAEEQNRFGDLVLLDLEDNITEGKTYYYFRWLAQKRSDNRPPRFAMKTDDDTFHVIPSLLSLLAPLSCQTPLYIGTSWGCAQDFPFHFGGLGYALSWPLVAWLGGGEELREEDTWGNEDARLGAYLLSLDREKEPVVTLDYSIQMGSWFDNWTFPKTTSTIALHYLKEPNVYRDYSQVMWNLWKSEGKEWSWEGGKEWVRRHGRMP